MAISNKRSAIFKKVKLEKHYCVSDYCCRVYSYEKTTRNLGYRNSITILSKWAVRSQLLKELYDYK